MRFPLDLGHLAARDAEAEMLEWTARTPHVGFDSDRFRGMTKFRLQS